MSALSPSWDGLGLWQSDFKSTIYKRSKSSLIRKKEKWAMRSRQLWVSWSPFCDIGVPRQTTMTTAAFWSQRRESNVIKTIMGGCFSFLHKPDLQTSTFSHYSLDSESSYLDLYPGFRYAETGSVSEEDTSTWRRSSVPLLHHQWDSGSGPSEQDLDSLPREPRLRYGEALVRLRRGLRSGENVGGGEERASALTASPRDSGSTVVEEI